MQPAQDIQQHLDDQLYNVDTVVVIKILSIHVYGAAIYISQVCSLQDVDCACVMEASMHVI